MKMHTVLASVGLVLLGAATSFGQQVKTDYRNHYTVNTYCDGFGGGWRWGGGFGDATTSVDTYKVGTLVVDMFDTHTKKLIWRGSASDTLSDKSDKNIKNFDKGVQKMFDHFPPGSKS